MEELSPLDTYNQVIKPQIFEKHCMPCHSSDIQKADVVLDAYEDAVSASSDIRNAAIKTSKMPPQSPYRPELSDSEKSILKNWLDQVDAIHP